MRFYIKVQVDEPTSIVLAATYAPDNTLERVDSQTIWTTHRKYYQSSEKARLHAERINRQVPNILHFRRGVCITPDGLRI